MKNKIIRNKILVILISVMMITEAIAQPSSIDKNKDPYKWMFGASWSFVDDNGKVYTKLFDLPGSFNFEYYPSRISFDRYLRYGWSLEFSAAYNKYRSSKLINSETGKSGIFLCGDVQMKYSFYRFMKGARRFEPYLSSGLGVTMRTSEDVKISPSFNMSFGANYWFTPNWGMQLQTTGKLALVPFFSESNYLQHTVGVVYRTGARKTRSDFDKRRYPWAHDKTKFKRRNS
jgi:hypothetical protein